MRIVEGLRGRVPMRMELSLRPDYGSIVPWVERAADGVVVDVGAGRVPAHARCAARDPGRNGAR